MDPNTPPPAPLPPGPGASREEWHAWRRQRRDYYHAYWPHYGPWSHRGPWSWFFPAALVLIGAYYLGFNLGLLDHLPNILWPSLLILLGLLWLAHRVHSPRP